MCIPFRGTLQNTIITQRSQVKILWLTWKDRANPLAGGAEVVNEEIAKRLVKNGHQLILLVANFPGGKRGEEINGYQIIRIGNKFNVYTRAYKYVKNYLATWPDLIVEEINTVPFMSQWYSKKPRVLLFYQLCRQIWFYQMKFPFSLIGYLFEPVYLRRLSGNKAITISECSKEDLIRYGFNSSRVKIMPVGIEIKPVDDLSKIKKYKNFTMLSLGSIREMKRPDQQILAFEIAKEIIPELKLKIAGGGSGKYYQKVMRLIKKSIHQKDIEYLGQVSAKQKIELMQRSHFIAVTSVKEGWGLIVTEAASQGTPAIVYNSDGLRSSVKDNETGLICYRNTPQYLAQKILELESYNQKKYLTMQKAAWEFSREINFENCYKEFIKIIESK